MSFRENLQYLRATHSMTQEQLAMLLGVSRQSVTKWEAERSYPEMDKLLKMCQIFECSLDDLVQGDLTGQPPTGSARAKAQAMRASAGAPPQDVCGYDQHMRAFARRLALGVFSIVMGAALFVAIAGIGDLQGPASIEALGAIPLFLGIGIGVALLVTAAFRHAEFQRSHPFLQDFYTAEDRQRTQQAFVWQLVGGILCIFGGVVLCIFFDEASEVAQQLAAAGLIALVAVGAALIVYGGIMLGRLNIANYNEAREQTIAESDEGKILAYEDVAALRAMYTDEQLCNLLGVTEASDEELTRVRARLERKRRKSQLTGGLCGLIMVVATIAGLVMLFVPDYRTPFFWMAWVVGGLLCAVASISVQTFVKDQSGE